MASSSTFRLSKNLSAITTSSIPNSESNPRSSCPLSNDRNNQNLHETDSEPHFHKHKASTQLDRWFRARAIRNGRRLDRHGHCGKTAGMIAPINGGNGLGFCHSPEKSNEKDNGEKTTMKVIYMVSSGTGWTVKHSVTAVLGQFEHYLTDLGCAVNTHLFSGIDDVERLMEIIKQAGKEGAMLFYTLAEPSMRESAKQGCKLWGVPSTDILGPITEAVAAHLNISPAGTPCKAPACRPLTKEYFQRIEAIEFTIKQDDGALPQNLHRADIVLSGVSRTGKTPLSIYLAQMGYKVANVPIVKGVELPKTLFELEPNKVFGLTINPVVLHTIRRARAKSLGFDDQMQSNYSELEHVREELEFASRVFAKNPMWSVIEMTGKAIEETAAVVLRLFNDGKQKCSTPQFSNSFS